MLILCHKWKKKWHIKHLMECVYAHRCAHPHPHPHPQISQEREVKGQNANNTEDIWVVGSSYFLVFLNFW